MDTELIADPVRIVGIVREHPRLVISFSLEAHPTSNALFDEIN